ncbi:hypothetical protein [Methanobrevibacter arboriphilus]|nr:hypothetical protein [Methanobrevibacter arboriphilus]
MMLLIQLKKIDKALDEEINSLEKAKNYAQTPEEKKIRRLPIKT